MKNYYITTAIPYANALPHIGTAMDYLYGDILLRYQLARGLNAKLSIGTDEHGTKVERKAAENNLSPQDFTNQLQPEFQKMRAALNLDFAQKDVFENPVEQITKPLSEQDFAKQNIINVRTTDPTHIKNVQDIWRRLDAAGVIYKSTYEGWYCSGCEAFLTETEAREIDYICPDHNKPLEKLSEENYYLRVSKFTDEIREFAQQNITPEFRGREILELIKNGAQDVSISRPKDKLAWGVPVPDDENQIMYVWVDALSNYITALNFPAENWQQDFWPADVEIVGKDILRFHAIIWPAMLLALGLDLPKKLLAHGFVNVGGSKMSKSIGNVVSPLEIIAEYGADAFRYYFSRHIPTFDDGDFTWEKFENAYNGELANDLGNLISRVANMIKKYCNGKIPNDPEKDYENNESSELNQLMENYEISRALDLIWGFYVQNNNKFIDERKPWDIAKRISGDVAEEVLQANETPKVSEENRTREYLDEHFPARSLRVILEVLVSNLRDLTRELEPFLPETAQKIDQIFGGKQIPDEIPILFPKKYLHTEEPKR